MQKKNIKGKTVVVGMSGGVDSSVCALLLKQQGANVIGLHMLGASEEAEKEDAKSVVSLCESLGIEYEIVSYTDEMQKVKDYFVETYKSGKTPNPCVLCNKNVKFSPFIEYSNKIGADYFATGHYANIEHVDGKHILKKAVDDSKDQSYFLNQLSQSQLEKAIFPLGSLTKTEVRKIAEENGLVSAHKKDSFDVCFVGSEKFKDYMSKVCPEKSGDIIDIASQKKVGTHQGVSKYTLGQRKGLGIGGGFGTTGECWFVASKDTKNNILYVAQGNGDVLYSDALVCDNFNWIPSVPEMQEFDCVARFRYRQADQKVRVKINQDGSVLINFYEKQRAVTTGQFAVLYGTDENGDYNNLIGGGEISKVIKK